MSLSQSESNAHPETSTTNAGGPSSMTHDQDDFPTQIGPSTPLAPEPPLAPPPSLPEDFPTQIGTTPPGRLTPPPSAPPRPSKS